MRTLTIPNDATQFAADTADIETVTVADLTREARAEVAALRDAFDREADVLAEAVTYPSFPDRRRDHAAAQFERLRANARGDVFTAYEMVDAELMREALRLIPEPVTVGDLAVHTHPAGTGDGGELARFGEAFAELRALRERAAFESTILAAHVRKPGRFPKARVVFVLEARDRLVQAARGRARFACGRGEPLF